MMFMSSQDNTPGKVLTAIIVTVIGGVITAAIVYHLHLGGSPGTNNSQPQNSATQAPTFRSSGAVAPPTTESPPPPASSQYSIVGSWVTPDGVEYQFLKTSDGSYEGKVIGKSGCGLENLNVISPGGGYYTGSAPIYLKELFVCTQDGQDAFTIQISANGKTAQFNVTSGCPGSCPPETWIRAGAP